MSRDGLFPPAITARHPSTGAPLRATAVLALLATVYVVLGTFEQIAAFFMCTTLGFVALAAAAVFVLRGTNESGGLDRATFRAPGYPLTPALFVLLVLTIVAMVAINRPFQAVAGLVLMLLGLPLSRLLTAFRQIRLAGGGR
jgi:APA family basic amino acid/polyamine antiporter